MNDLTRFEILFGRMQLPSADPAGLSRFRWSVTAGIAAVHVTMTNTCLAGETMNAAVAATTTDPIAATDRRDGVAVNVVPTGNVTTKTATTGTGEPTP